MSREAMQTAYMELSALIATPYTPKVDDWPCENPADRECLQRAYIALRAALSEPVATHEGNRWTLTSPDGRMFFGDSPLRCVKAEMDTRIPASEQLANVYDALREPPASEPVQPGAQA